MADSILRLKVDSQEYDQKIKRAAEGIERFANQVYKSGGAVTELEKDEVAFIKALGNMETVSKSATGKLREMESAYKNLSATYHMLQKDQQNDAGGKALRSSLDQLKARIDETRTAIKKADTELNGFTQTEKNFSKESFDLNGILSQVGGQMGINTSMLSGLTAGTMGYAAAVAAVVKAEYEAAKAFKEYNDELARQSQITTVTTGLDGNEASNMTAAARALSKVYGTDFREVINAANTLMTQFGTDGEFAINLIRKGMRGMIQGDGPKLLQMIQQYAPAFRDAGIQASQLIAIIQNSEGGIFTDENMNAIVMGIKNIRLMTKATSDALAEIGINGQKMSKDLSDGTITIFDALRKVSEALEGTESGSQQAGQVMQQVFGRQGTMAGTNLAKAIATLNTNLEQTMNQTGEVGKSFDELARKTEELDKAMMNLLQVDDWDVLKNEIESGIVGAMTTCVNLLNDALDVVNNIGKAFGGPVVQGVVDFLVALSSPIGLIYEAYRLLKGEGGNAPKPETDEEKAQKSASTYIAHINSSKDKAGTYSKDIARLNKTLNKYQNEGRTEDAAKVQRIIEIVEEHMDKTFGNYGGTGKKNKITPTKPTKTVKKKSIDDIINEQYPDIAQAESVGQSYGEQITEGILVGMAEKAQTADVTTLKTLMETVIKNGIEGVDIPADELMSKIIGDGADISDETWQKLQDAINEKLKEMNIEPIEIDFSTGNIKTKKPDKKEDKEKEKYLSDGLSKLGGGLGGIQSGFQQMGIDLGDGFSAVVGGLQGITTILTAIQTIVGAIELISSADAIIPFARGGVVHAAGGFMVPGNNFSGDLVPAYLNSGEMVLNRFQQQALAGTLENGGMKNISISGHLEGETIALSVDRWGKRSGRGELAFWKNQ